MCAAYLDISVSVLTVSTVSAPSDGLVIASLCWVAAPELAELLARAGQDTSSVFIPAGDM